MDRGLTLRDMTEDEFAAYRPHLARGYAEERAEAGDRAPEEALARSEAELDELLPDGLAQPDTLLLTAVGEDGVAVGVTWIALVHPRGVGSLGLNVFGSNEAARRLYESAGYAVTTQQMQKRLGPSSR